MKFSWSEFAYRILQFEYSCKSLAGIIIAERQSFVYMAIYSLFSEPGLSYNPVADPGFSTSL